MKLNCGPSYAERVERKSRWHDWFAWYPVRVAEGDCRWLEVVECRGTYDDNWVSGGWTFEYRAKVRT